MRVFEINSVPYGSTGMIARKITTLSKVFGDSCFAYSWTKKKKNHIEDDEFLIGSVFEKACCLLLERLTGNICCYSVIGTLALLKEIDSFKPDVVHLHNLHEGYVNIGMLFSYLKKKNINVVWTLHDCWAFTGHCPHFDMIRCDKWKNVCNKCPIYKNYPRSLFDNSRKMFLKKKSVFNMIDKEKMKIVAPSKWLSSLVKQSYLSKYDVVVINNGIDLETFKSVKSNFRSKHHCGDKTVLLGVSYEWNDRKGLDVFIRLAKELDDSFRIVLVGTDEKVDSNLPPNIISIHRTSSKKELAEIYSSSDIFINPTREEVFGLVNVEAIACGIPVITFDTGGCSEIINDRCGRVIAKDDFEDLLKAIHELRKNKIDKSICMREALNYYDKNKYAEYISLFKSICGVDY